MLANSLYSSAFLGSVPTIKAMKYHFFMKKTHLNKDGKYPLYVNLYMHGARKRIPIDIFVKETDWDPKREQVKNPKLKDLNLLINQVRAQINKIEIQFRLNGEVLTVEKCADLLKRPDLSIDFISFMEYEMDLKSMTDGARNNQKVILAKLREFRKSILFIDINERLILQYRRFLSMNKSNAEVTIDSNVKIVKHYIKLAKKRGFQINIDLDDIKIKQHRSHRTNLTLQEVDRMKEYLFSSFISDAHKKSLGYFIFNCMTGLRIEDLRRLKREDLNDEYFNFWNQKSKKQQVLKTNETCKKILENDENLFIEPVTAKTINETIQDIAKFLKIRKHVSNHVARHTFATNYLRKGGKVEDLQILLAHSNIKTTMIYAHIVEDEVVETVHLLD